MFSRDFVNGEVSIPELYDLQAEIWANKNAKLIGITANSSESPFLIKESIKNDLENYWVNGTCDLKEHLVNNAIKSVELMIKDSWNLEYNSITNLIGLAGYFVLDSKNRVHNSSLKKIVDIINELPYDERMELAKTGKYETDDNEYIISYVMIAYLPFVTHDGYKIRKSEYVLRTQAYRNRFALRKVNGVVKQNGWVFKDGEFEDGINHFKDIHENYYPFLSAIINKPVNEDNIVEALEKMPEYDASSILYFNFRWFEEVEVAVLNNNRKVNPKQSKLINYVSIINSPKKYSNRELRDLCTNLVIVHNKISALEKSRSIIFSPTTEYASSFSFSDSDRLFDSFKVTTNALAGRVRVLLDNVYVEDNMLKVTYKGKTYNHYDIAFGNIPAEIDPKNGTNLSCISRAPYNYLNDAKRIMFCAKLRGQSVRVKGQIDDLTNEVPARVVFADWLGFNFGDSFVISESFAKKLERDVVKRFNLPQTVVDTYEVGQHLTTKDLVDIEGKDNHSSYRDIVVTNKYNDELEIKARVPFGVGDKITNLHGSKGIVSIILPDESMPCLENDLSPNMPAGPVDVIIPGVSVFRRKSTGQVFEAITRALDIEEMDLKELNKKYGKKIQKFDNGSVFTFFGKKFSAPCGINHMIRLDHDATTKQSFAYIKSNYNYNLRIAEMELLNLAARGCYDILNELDIRSLNKHSDSLAKISNMQRTGIIAEEPMDSQYFKDFMKFLGWDFKDFAPVDKGDIDERWNTLIDIISNDEIDIFDMV